MEFSTGLRPQKVATEIVSEGHILQADSEREALEPRSTVKESSRVFECIIVRPEEL